jgi:hypothetical protein
MDSRAISLFGAWECNLFCGFGSSLYVAYVHSPCYCSARTDFTILCNSTSLLSRFEHNCPSLIFWRCCAIIVIWRLKVCDTVHHRQNQDRWCHSYPYGTPRAGSFVDSCALGGDSTWSLSKRIRRSNSGGRLILEQSVPADFRNCAGIQYASHLNYLCIDLSCFFQSC